MSVKVSLSFSLLKVRREILDSLESLRDAPRRRETPLIYHLVTMYLLLALLLVCLCLSVGFLLLFMRLCVSSSICYSALCVLGMQSASPHVLS